MGVMMQTFCWDRPRRMADIPAKTHPLPEFAVYRIIIGN